MAGESNVGLRVLVMGKDAAIASIRAVTGAQADLNKTIKEGATASKASAAGYAEQEEGLSALGVKMDMYQAQLGRTAAETDALAKVGKVAFFTLAAAGAAWTVESIKWAQNYQSELIKLRTQAGLTVSAMNQIGAAAMRNASSLGITPTAYVTAAYHPASTGMSTAEVIAITNNAAKLAAIGGAPVEDTTQSLTTTMKAYGFGAGQTQHTAALLNSIVGAGNMRWTDLNSALSSGLASSAQTFGVSLGSMGGALARLTDLGTPGAQAGTRLRMALALLGGPTQESDKLLTAVGLDSTQRTAAQSDMASALVSAGLTTTQLSGALRDNNGAGGIYNALELLHKHLGGMNPETQAALITRAFGGGRMGTSILQLYSNLPALQQKSSQIQGGATNKRYMADWADTTKTLNFQLHQLGAELETVGIQFGTKLLPYVTDGIKDFTSFLKLLDQNKGLAIVLGSAITAVLVPAIGLYLYRALLSSGGAIRGVLSAYQRLIFGQSEEDAALVRTDAALATTTGYTGRLAAEDDLLAGTSGRTGGLAGLGGGIGGKLLGAAGLAGGGILAGSLIRGSAGTTLNSRATAANQIRSVLGDMAEGAGVGAAVGSVIPGVGTLIGGAVGAGAGGIYAERHQIGHALSSGWDDLFGGGSSQPQFHAPNIRSQIHVHSHTYLDSKEITKGVAKTVKAKASRQ